MFVPEQQNNDHEKIHPQRIRRHLLHDYVLLALHVDATDALRHPDPHCYARKVHRLG